MAIGLKLNSQHDLSYVDGELETTDKGDLVAQNLTTRFRTLAGEVLLDNTYGFQYRRIFEQRLFDFSILETLVKNYLLETDGVTNITQFQIGHVGGDTRRTTVTFSVTTIYSQFIFDEEVSFAVWNEF